MRTCSQLWQCSDKDIVLTMVNGYLDMTKLSRYIQRQISGSPQPRATKWVYTCSVSGDRLCLRRGIHFSTYTFSSGLDYSAHEAISWVPPSANRIRSDGSVRVYSDNVSHIYQVPCFPSQAFQFLNTAFLYNDPANIPIRAIMYAF